MVTFRGLLLEMTYFVMLYMFCWMILANDIFVKMMIHNELMVYNAYPNLLNQSSHLVSLMLIAL